jgi:hypothetical protein
VGLAAARLDDRAFHRARHARTVMLMVPACPESGFLERAARPR